MGGGARGAPAPLNVSAPVPERPGADSSGWAGPPGRSHSLGLGLRRSQHRELSGGRAGGGGGRGTVRGSLQSTRGHTWWCNVPNETKQNSARVGLAQGPRPRSRACAWPQRPRATRVRARALATVPARGPRSRSVCVGHRADSGAVVSRFQALQECVCFSRNEGQEPFARKARFPREGASRWQERGRRRGPAGTGPHAGGRGRGSSVCTEPRAFSGRLAPFRKGLRGASARTATPPTLTPQKQSLGPL